MGRALVGMCVLMACAAGAGGQCTALANDFNGRVSGPVRALAGWRYSTGAAQALVIGGEFTRVEPVQPFFESPFPCNSIGHWTGTGWSAFGLGMDGPVSAVLAWDRDGAGSLLPQVVGGGLFVRAGTESTGMVVVNNIARWENNQWRTLGTGTNGQVRALTAWDPDGAGTQGPNVVAGGSFTHAGGVWVDYIGAWNGTGWRALGWGLDGAPHCLTTWDRDGSGPQGAVLLAGGAFTAAGSDSTGQVAAAGVAVWDGTVWAGLGLTGGGVVSHIDTFDFDGAGPEHAAPVIIHNGRPKRWSAGGWTEFGANAGGTWVHTALGVADSPGGARVWLAAMRTDIPGWRKVWSEDGEGRATPMLDATASVLEAWDPDGPSGEPPVMGAAGSTAGRYVESYAFEPAVVITDQPDARHARVGADATFGVTVAPGGAVTYRWSKRGRFGWESLENGAQASGSTVSGAQTQTLTIQGISPRDAISATPVYGEFYTLVRCYVSSRCETVVSGSARLDISPCSADFNSDGDFGMDADIEAFFACLAGSCCATCGSADFDGDGDGGTDADIESFFRVLAGGAC